MIKPSIYISLVIWFLFQCTNPIDLENHNPNTNNENDNQSYYYLGKRHNGGDIIYNFQLIDQTLKGHVSYLSPYLDKIDSMPITGSIDESQIEWHSYQKGYKRFYNSGIIDLNGEIKIARFLPNELNQIDSVFLTRINVETYQNKITESLAPPALITMARDTVIGNYIFELVVNNWNPKTFMGKTVLTIKDKTSKGIIQILKSDNFWFDRHLNFGYGSDYNFDKIPDLSFYTGNNGSYGSPSSDYYIFDPDKNEFIYSQQLAYIADGLSIEFDTEKRRIKTFNKSGCCYHIQEVYIVQQDSIVLMKQLIEDEGINKLIIKSKSNQKWNTVEKTLSDLTSEELSKIYDNF